MSVSALKKCLEELKSDNCRKDYVIGILETLIEMQETNRSPVTTQLPIPPYYSVSATNAHEVANDTLKNIIEPPELNEGQILEAKTQARIKEIKALSDKSTELA